MTETRDQTEREFHIGVILSVLTGRLLSPTMPPIAGVYDILNFMTGDNLFTNQLPRAADECRPSLAKQHPDLAAVDASGVTEENWADLLAEWCVSYGAVRSVRPILPEDHEWIDPVSELAEKVHPDKIVVVKR